MSYTIVGKPDKFSPVYNPIFFYSDSSNKNEEGYKYVVDIYSGNTSGYSPTKLARYKVFPRVNDGYGVIDINQLLSSQVSYYFNQDVHNIVDATKAYLDYKVEFGEEFVKYWSFTGITTSSTSPYIEQTQIKGISSGHPFIAGDNILVQQTTGSTSDYYNGVFVVLSASSTSVIVDLPHSVSSAIAIGTITYSDRRKTIYSNITSESGYTAFNGAVSHQDLQTYSGSQYSLTENSNHKLLTNVPNNYILKPNNSMWLDFHISGGTNFGLVKIETRYGYYDELNCFTTDVMSIGVGPSNVSTIEGTANCVGNHWNNDFSTYPVFKNACWDYITLSGTPSTTTVSGLTQSPWYNNFSDELVDYYVGTTLYQATINSTPSPNQVELIVPLSSFSGITIGTLFQRTDYYDITVYNVGGISGISETLHFEIDWETTRYGNIELLFIDRLGSFIPANFELQNTTTINIDRSNYQTLLGDLKSTGKWGFNSYDMGRRQLNTSVRKSIDLNSNWMSEDSAKYMQELFTSPMVFMKDNEQYWPVIITSNSYVIRTKNNKKNIQIALSLEIANQDRIQNF